MNQFTDQFPHLAHIDPLTHVRKERSLPPEPACTRLSDVMALVEPRIGAALLDAPGRAALHRIASRLSAHLSPFWGFEMRLGDPAPRADILWEVTQGNGSVPTLAGRNPHDPASKVTSALRRRSPFWRELGRFAEEWLDSPDWLRRLGNIWIEADTASTSASSDTAIDACLDRPSLFWGPFRRVAGSDRDLLAHLAALGRRFYGIELDQARLDALADTVPEEAELFQMGVMGARTSPAVRLCVKGLDARTTPRWLAAMGWPGDRERLRDVLARVGPLCGDVALDVDVLPDRAGPKLGIELYGAERMLSVDTWQPLHDMLLAQGLALADKVAALADYPWYQRFGQYGAWNRTPPIGHPVISANLHHLKLVFVEDAVIEAKVYLGVFRPVVDYSRSPGQDTDGGGWRTTPAHDLRAAIANGSRSETSSASCHAVPRRASATRAAAGRKLVFLGPSLALAEARRICPDAQFHPPVRFGDLYALGGDPPGQVLLIDGVFHDDTPVWQREILELLQAGWQVLGASSMGALRALELEPYGMVGLGTIFEWYRSGAIEGDDEVALLHGVAEVGYLPLTVPLVDVRHVLGELEAQGALTAVQVSNVLSALKRMGHGARTHDAVLALVKAHGAEVAAVRDRLSDRARSLKAQDARLALRVLAGREPPPPATMMHWPDPPPPPVQPEAVLRRRVHPLAGSPLLAVDALRAMVRQPDALSRPLRESRRRWFLCDWVQVSGKGPDAAERCAFAMRHAAGLARELGVSLSRWCAASALREDELVEWTAGLAVESWLDRQSAGELGITHPPQGDQPSLIPLVLVDWMRHHGAEVPREHRASTGHMASWLVQMGPGFFGAPDWHPDVAVLRVLATSGELARWGRSAQTRAGPEGPP